MNRRRWLTLLGVGVGGPAATIAVLDIHAAVTGGVTLSQSLRETFRTDTTAGKALFAGLYLGSVVPFTVWFLPHIVNVASDVIEELS